MDFKSLISEFITVAKLRAADGLTFVEIGQTFVGFLHLCVEWAANIPGPGATKKQAVMDAFTTLWSVVEPGLPLPVSMKLFWLVLKYPVRQIAYSIASGAVEAIVNKYREGTESHG